jgi:hypothetical protein
MKPIKQIVPTTTALEARLRIFQPSQKPINKEIAISTDWGTAVVKGRLGQRHADLLEAIRVCALTIVKTDTGGFNILVDPFEIRKKIGTGYYSYEQMKKLLEDLRNASVRIDTPEFSGYGGLINEYIESKKPVPKTGSGALDGKERYLMIVSIGKIGATLLQNDILLYYDPAPITKLTSGMSQAIARHVLTHKTAPNGGWKLDSLIEAVAGDDLKPYQKRQARQAVRKDTENLASCGIYLDSDRVNTKSLG